MMEGNQTSSFIGETITVRFEESPVHEKSPTCPAKFEWRGVIYPVTRLLFEWHDFTRRGRAAQNMRPSHATAAAGRGSLGVGRFYFRVRTQSGRIFEIYYDRAPKDALHSKGEWYVYRELFDK